MNAHHEALARDFLKMTDTHGDIFALLTDDIYSRTQMGTARSKEELGKFYQDIGAYVQTISHNPDTFKLASVN